MLNWNNIMIANFSRIMLLVIFPATFIFLACDKKGPIIISDPEILIPKIIPNGDEAYLTNNSDVIFDQSSLHTFELKLSGSDLMHINSDPVAEEYVEAMLIFRGDTISPVGLRYKGSVGGFVDCLSEDDWTNPSGFKTCSKLSMKVKINWEGREDKFYGLKKLQFHSMNLDDSKMRDRLGYYLFREMGVPAPRAVHARLIINGQFAGLFSLVEQIDGRFVKYNFDDDDGNLYKEVWPVDSDGNVHADHIYAQALRTNENENPSFEIIKTLGESVEAAIDSQIPLIIESQMDLEETISMVAVDRTIRHDDGPFHWYCFGGDCSSHNFYWYEEPTNKKLHLIPWDLDNAFENIISNKNPVTCIADEWGEVSNDCEPFVHGSWNFKQMSASCDKLTAGWASYEELYTQKTAELINGPMSKASVDMLLENWANQIQTAVEEENEKFNDVVSKSQWGNAIDKMKQRLEHARSE